ncbi:hypothetical protein BH10ACT7_BH10ACT7_16520 [soil metagenome]
MEFVTAALPDRKAFAAANGLSFEPIDVPTGFGGAVFEYLQNKRVTDRFVASSGPAFEVGNLTGSLGGSQPWLGTNGMVTTSFTSTEVRTYGYMAMQLERALPQLVLDSTRNDSTFRSVAGGSSIPMPIAGGQRLTLEGDFNNHFALYAPAGYERDALYVFAPDLMALLIDETGDFDVEIVDDMLFVYSTTPLDTSDTRVWDRLARIRTVVGGKAITQTDLYADDRSAAGTVTEHGQRLRMGFFGAGSGGFGKRLFWVVGGILVLAFGTAAVIGFLVLGAATR